MKRARFGLTIVRMATPSPPMTAIQAQPGIATRSGLESELAQPNTPAAMTRTISAPEAQATPFTVMVSSPTTGPR